MLTVTQNPGITPPSVYSSAEYGRTVAEEEDGIWLLIRDDQGDWQLPLVLRRIPGTDHMDAATPYGYGGLHIGDTLSDAEAEDRWQKTVKLLQDRGVVSVFLRFPPFLPRQAERASSLPGLSVRDVSQTILVPTGTDEDMWAAMRQSSRRQVRSAEKAGCSVEITPPSPPLIDEARSLYEQTMDRVGATNRYYFSEGYFHSLSRLGEELRIARVVSPAGTCVASSFVFVDHEFAHYHLGGSSREIPGVNNLMFWGLFQWATHAGLKAVHLGGGLSDGDSLFKFKSSLGGAAETFSLGSAILLDGVYDDLVTRRAGEIGAAAEELKAGHFFPAYRAS